MNLALIVKKQAIGNLKIIYVIQLKVIINCK